MLEKYKARERAMETVLPEEGFCAIRLDGKAFGSFTRQYERPFDYRFMESMDAAALTVIGEILPDALIGYVQSDEITVVFSRLTSSNRSLPFGGRGEKILSTAASAATAGFLLSDRELQGLPLFDARFTLLEDLQEVQEHIDWRRLDARKNAISMAAQTLRSHRELQGVKTIERKALLEGTALERLPEGFYNGRLLVRRQSLREVSFTHSLTGETGTALKTVKSWERVAALRETTEREVSLLSERLVDSTGSLS